jgi:hypothetical protein
MNFNVKVTVKTEKKYKEERKIVHIFQNSKWKKEYTVELNSRLEVLENIEDHHQHHVIYFL